MSEKTSKFGDVEVNKKGFHTSKKPSILAFYLKYFIGYREDDIIRPLCIILPQITHT